MDALTPTEINQLNGRAADWMRFDDASDTLVIDDVEVRVDFNLGDDDLGVELLIESLEEQYEDMVLAAADHDDNMLALQSTKEWVTSNRDRVAGLIRYLRTLSS